MSDFFLVVVLSGTLVAVIARACLLSVRIAILQRRLDEEKAYNEMADAKVGELGADCVYLEGSLARLTKEHEQLRWQYVQLTREQLAENYVIIHRNVTRKESKRGK